MDINNRKFRTPKELLLFRAAYLNMLVDGMIKAHTNNSCQLVQSENDVIEEEITVILDRIIELEKFQKQKL